MRTLHLTDITNLVPSSHQYFDCDSLICCPRYSHVPTPPRHPPFIAASTAATDDARALEAQTERRAARRAAREKAIKERAREAVADLGRGGLKGPRTVDSTNFARDFKLGIAKRVRCVLNE